MRPLRLVTSHLLTRQVAVAKRARVIPFAWKHHIHTDLDPKSSEPNQSRRNTSHATTIGIVGLITAITSCKTIHAFRQGKDNSKPKAPHQQKVFKRAEVAQHNSLEKEVWITYKGNVYDITNFIRHHPGGSHTIMMGAGGDVGPFWQTYTVHEASEVQRLLATYQIGVLPEDEQPQSEVDSSQGVLTADDPYANDPKRSQLLEVLTQKPFNAETPSKLLTPTAITPTEIFFVRNHLPVPEVDLEDYTLAICVGTDADPGGQKVLAEFTLEDLKKNFKPHTIECVMQCSGNRRTDLKKIKEIKGLDWKVGAISNATWTGVRLVDLLDSLNVDRDDDTFKHVQMEGLDYDMTGQSYAASISADVAFDPKRDVLLAYEMNGKPLTRDHGFPLRFVAPGITGARNVKWLSKIILSHEESNSHWQRNDYKSFSPRVDLFNLDYKQSISVQEMPVQSAICDPVDGETIELDSRQQQSASKPLTLPVKGYAYSGGGKMIVRVDISLDGGKTWLTANLEDLPKNSDGTPDYSNRNRRWSWTRWSIDLQVPDRILKSKSGSLEILCRAFDSAYNSQPERAETVWNVRGVVNNSWHKVRLDLRIK